MAPTLPTFFLSCHRERERTPLKCGSGRSQVEVTVRSDLRVWNGVSKDCVEWTWGRSFSDQTEPKSSLGLEGKTGETFFTTQKPNNISYCVDCLTIDDRHCEVLCYAWPAQMFNIIVSKEQVSRLLIHSQRHKPWFCLLG